MRSFDGKVTYVHRRLWPALVRLASRFPKARLAKTWNEHTPWVPAPVLEQAATLSTAEAEMQLSPFLVAARGVRWA